MSKLAIVGASGKLGTATLNAILDHNLLPATQIVCTTSSASGAQKLSHARARGVEIRSANWDDSASLAAAFEGCARVFLISSARIDKDFNEAAEGDGREADHFRAIAAAKRSGVTHVYYSSLAFANPSASRVMKAHERTEAYLRSCGIAFTLIREGLYSESWPLYLGHFEHPGDTRSEIVVAGEGRLSWTGIPDLGVANALILTDPVEEWAGKTLYLSQSKSYTLEETAAIVAQAREQETRLKVVARPEHERYYVEERKMDRPFIEWWSKTYDALRDGECEIRDPTLETLLSRVGLRPTSFEKTVHDMYQSDK